jgi:hypothetical protein
MAKNTLDWKNDGQDVDTDNLTPTLKGLYDKFKSQSAEARASREAFENAFVLAGRAAKFIKADQTLAFGHNFGKCRVVVVPLEAPKAKATKGIKL